MVVLRLTDRLLSPHHRLTQCRKTLDGPGFRLRPCEISLVTIPRSARTFIVLFVLAASVVAALSVASPAGRRDALREEGARRLVRQRAHRPAVPAELLRGGDRRDPGRPPRLRGRRGDHHARAASGAQREPRLRWAPTRLRTTRIPTSTVRGGSNPDDPDGIRHRRRPRRASTRRARRRCPSRCSCSAACRSRCSPQVGSVTSRAVARLRTPTTPSTTR